MKIKTALEVFSKSRENWELISTDNQYICRRKSISQNSFEHLKNIWHKSKCQKYIGKSFEISLGSGQIVSVVNTGFGKYGSGAYIAHVQHLK